MRIAQIVLLRCLRELDDVANSALSLPRAGWESSLPSGQGAPDDRTLDAIMCGWVVVYLVFVLLCHKLSWVICPSLPPVANQSEEEILVWWNVLSTAFISIWPFDHGQSNKSTDALRRERFQQIPHLCRFDSVGLLPPFRIASQTFFHSEDVSKLFGII